jgi:DNA-directed RNA polymerase sigma subunit (sigma70/sigma32)
MSSTLPLHPTDDGWPYPEPLAFDVADADVDFDALELFGPHCYECLTEPEREALFLHFGLRGNDALTIKELAPKLGMTRAETATLVGTAIDKVRVQLMTE